MQLPSPIAAACLALGLAACGTEAEPASTAEPGAADAAAPRSLILISIDTLRADRLGCYGEERPTSPHLDRLAAEGVLFEDAMTTSPWTLPSHASLLTGRYPSRHGMLYYTHKLASDVPVVAESFQAAGFATACVVNTLYLSKRYGLQAGFRDFAMFDGLQTTEMREPSPVAENATHWIREHADEPFFAFLHFYDVHSTYASEARFEEELVAPTTSEAEGTTRFLMEVRDGTASFDERDADHVEDLYVAGIRQMDEVLGRLIAFLDEEGLADETVLVVTADHGEEFLEHGGVMHGTNHFQELMHVPLILRGPGLPAGVRVSTPVSLVDVVPTLLALFDLPPLASDGLDLSPLWRGESIGDRLLFGEADQNNEEPDTLRSIRHGKWKYVYNRLTGEAELYDLEADPLELSDVIASHPKRAKRYSTELARHLEGTIVGEPAAVFTDEERASIEALGY